MHENIWNMFGGLGCLLGGMQQAQPRSPEWMRDQQLGMQNAYGCLPYQSLHGGALANLQALYAPPMVMKTCACPGCGARKSVVRKGRPVCAYCGNDR